MWGCQRNRQCDSMQLNIPAAELIFQWRKGEREGEHTEENHGTEQGGSNPHALRDGLSCRFDRIHLWLRVHIYGAVRCVVWGGVGWGGVVQCGVLCGVVRGVCGAVRCSAVRCGVVCYAMVCVVWFGVVWCDIVGVRQFFL